VKCVRVMFKTCSVLLPCFTTSSFRLAAVRLPYSSAEKVMAAILARRFWRQRLYKAQIAQNGGHYASPMLSAIRNVEMAHRSICLPDFPSVLQARYSLRD
jgi:hypothetical protein